MIHVLIAEDHSMVRAGIRALLEKYNDIIVVGEAANGQEAFEMAEKLKPDVLLMDIMMPRLNGIQAAERLRLMKVPVGVLLLSMYADESLVRQALRSGARSYVLKSSVSDELISAVRATARGETYLSQPIASIVEDSAFRPQSVRESEDPLTGLSPREREIMQLIAEEHTTAEIARLLVISEKTVEKHRTNLMEKLNIHNVAGLVRLAIKYGLVEG